MMISRNTRGLVLALAGAIATTGGCVGDPQDGDPTDEAQIDEAVSGGCTITISSQESAVTYGDTIHLSAVASCPSGPAEIAWYQRTLRQGFSTATTFNFDSTQGVVGAANAFYAVARQQGTQSPLTTSNTVNVTINDNVPACTSAKMLAPVANQNGQVGTPMTVSATATCPAGVTPEIQYWVKPVAATTWTFLPGYFPGPSSWTPSASGQYYVSAAARGVGAHVQYSVRANAILVNIAPAAVDNPPVANADAITTTENVAGSVNALANDTDADGDPLTISAVTQGSNGGVTFSGGVVTYTPNAGFVGPDVFTYTASDGRGGFATGNVNVTVIDQAPVAVDDALVTTVHATGTADVILNDTDPDGDTLSIASFTQGANGTVAFSGTVAIYTPAPTFVGSDSFTYTISDGHPGGLATAHVDVTVVDRNPVAVDDSITTAANSAGSTDVLANDSDADGDPLAISGTTDGAHGTVTFSGSVVTYTPAANFTGTDSFTYTVSDGLGGSATGNVSVTVTDLAPVAVDDSIVTPENTPGSVDVLANDSDPNGDPLTISGLGQGTHGTTSANGAVVTYTPATGYVGPDAFVYEISDGQGGFAQATVNVMVTNQPPVALDDALATNVNTAGTVNVLANDSDPNGDTLTITSFTQGAHGTVQFAGGVATYTPAPNYAGADSFGYTISDGNGGSASATVNVTVTALTPGCTISISTPTTQAQWGDVIHFTATAQCNTGPAQIQWYQRTVVQPWSSSNTLDFTANMVGNMVQFYAQARTQGTITPVATSNLVNVNVVDNVPACTKVTLLTPANNSVASVGQPLTLNATAVCPAGYTPEIQYWVKTANATTWTFLPGYFPGASSWTPPSTGQWYVTAVARAVGAHVQYSVKGMAALVNVQ